MRPTGDSGRRPSPYPRPATPRAIPRKARSQRRRYAAGAVAVAAAAAMTFGFVSSYSAVAEEGDTNTVSFDGNCGVLGVLHKSEPDKAELEVTEGQKVTFVNQLGTKATLKLGDEEYEVGKDDKKVVKLEESGEAVMSPHCPIKLREKADPSAITVSAKESDEGSKAPGDGNGGDNGSGNDSGDTPDSGNPGGDADNGDVGVPNDGEAPAASGKVPDPKDDAKKDDDAEKDDESSEAAAPPATDSDTPANAEDTVEAADTSNAQQGASTMLALLAGVCLAGVGVAAVRTLIVNRTPA